MRNELLLVVMPIKMKTNRFLSMKNIYSIFIAIILVGCSSSPNKQTFYKNKTPTNVFIYPKEAYKFIFNGRHIIVDAILKDSVEISLLFDTGAQSPIFDSTFISRNKDKLQIELKKTKGKTITPKGEIKFSSIINSKLEVIVLGDTINVRKGFVNVADLSKTGLNADTIFPAYWIFHSKLVLMDIKHEYFIFLSKNIFDSIKSQFRVFPLIGNQVTYFRIPTNIDITVANENINIIGELMIDIRAPGLLYLQAGEKSLLDISKPLAPVNIPENLNIHRTQIYAWNPPSMIQENIFVANQISMLDSMTFENENITILPEFRITPKQVGILGNEFFRKFEVIFDFKNKLFCLKPNEEYIKHHLPYSLGMKLYRSLDLKTLYVYSLYESSPAIESGIQLGDTILKINSKSTERISIDELKSIEHSKPSTILTLEVKRNQEILFYEIIIDSLGF